MAFQQPGKIVFEGGGGAGAPAPQAPAAAVPWSEQENRAELIFGPIANITLDPQIGKEFKISIPTHLRNKHIMVIVFVRADSQIRFEFWIYRSDIQLMLWQVTGSNYRTQELFVADIIRIYVHNTDTANARNVQKIEIWAYDLTKTKVFI